MTNQRGRNRAARKAAAKRESAQRTQPPPPPPTPPPPPKRRLLERLWAIAKVIWLVPVGLLGVLATVNSMWGPPWPTKPEYHIVASSAGQPFAFPFSVTNKSAFFDTRLSGTYCRIKRGRIGGMILEDLGAATFEGLSFDVPAKETKNYRCSIQMGGQLVTSLELAVQSDYRSLFRSGTVTQDFHWVAAGKDSRWVEGADVE